MLKLIFLVYFFSEQLSFFMQTISSGQTARFPVHISDYGNFWNQIALELARPTLHVLQPPVDKAKVARLRQELIAVSRRDKVGWWANS